MSRRDDARDEHDINELRNLYHHGKKPQFAGKPGRTSGFCGLITLTLVAVPVVAAVAAAKGWT